MKIAIIQGILSGHVERHGKRKFITNKTIEGHKMCGKFWLQLAASCHLIKL